MNAPERIPAPTRTPIDGATWLPLTLIQPSPTNPRKHFDQAHLDELADSIRKHGVIQPILVRPKPGAKKTDGQAQYELVAGERRWRASQIAEQPSIMALVRDMTDFEVLELQVIENLQREDLHPLEEAEGYAALLRRPDGLQGYANAEEIAARIGRSERYVYNRLALLKLCPQAREACLDGKLTASVALLVSALPADDQPAATEKLALGWGGEPYSARAAAAYLRDHFSLQLKKAPFPIADATLLPAAGACSACPKRTCANPDLFTDQAGGGIDSCLDRKCFDAKATAHRELALEAHRAKGHEVLTDAEAKKLMPYGAQSLRGAYLLDEPCALATSRKPLRQLLGQYAEVVVLDLHDTLYEVAREAYVKKTLKTNGYLKPPAKKDEPEQQPDALLPKPAKGKQITPADIKKARDAAIAERWPELARKRLAEHLMASDAKPFTDALQRMLVTTLLQTSEEPFKPMIEMAGLDAKKLPMYPGLRDIRAAIEGATAQQLYTLSILALAETYRDQRDELIPLQAVAAELGFDLQPAIDAATEQVQAQMAAELEQLKAPPAPAAKKAAAKRPAKDKDATEAFVDAHAKSKAGALKPTVKYRCPATGSTWSGRGVGPAWVKAALDSGKALDELLAISEEAA